MLQISSIYLSNTLTWPMQSSGSEKMRLTDFLTLRGDNSTIRNTYDDPSVFVSLIVNNLFVLAGVVIFFMIIGAGFSYLKDSEKGKDEAKNLATGAVIGFLVMFSAYWIVQIIKLVTGADIPISGSGPA